MVSGLVIFCYILTNHTKATCCKVRVLTSAINPRNEVGQFRLTELPSAGAIEGELEKRCSKTGSFSDSKKMLKKKKSFLAQL